ncbi:MAG: hypothetical protein ACREA7_08130 [Nitrosotalea sp.]
MARGLEIVEIDILSNAVIVGEKTNQVVDNPHLSLMMDVLFMILCRKIQSDNPPLLDQSSD